MATTTKHAGGFRVYHRRFFPLAAGVKALGGTIAAFSLAGGNKGYALPGALSEDLLVVGRFGQDTVDNTAGGNGAKSAEIQFGAPFEAFRWLNDTVAPVTQAHVGSLVYVKDNNTVTSSPTGASVAGICWDVENGGTEVYVQNLPGSYLPEEA